MNYWKLGKTNALLQYVLSCLSIAYSVSESAELLLYSADCFRTYV